MDRFPDARTNEMTEMFAQRGEGGAPSVVVAKRTTTVAADKSKWSKALPWILLGIGAVIFALWVLPSLSNRGGGQAAAGAQTSQVLAPFADPAYGTPTDSGIPAYDQYQSKYPPTQAVRDVNANPEALGLTYQNAMLPAPVSIIQDGRNLFKACPSECGANVGCIDSSAANYDPSAQCDQIGGCVRKTYGCLRRDNPSYNPFANTHDERFCTAILAPTPSAVAAAPIVATAQPVLSPGCTNINNSMFDPTANVMNDSCVSGGMTMVAPAAVNVAPQGCVNMVAPASHEGVGCYAPMTDQNLGFMRGCGDPWDMSKNNSLGATMY